LNDNDENAPMSTDARKLLFKEAEEGCRHACLV